MNVYPMLVRNQWHGHHDYTLRLADNIEVQLTEQQVLSLREQIEQDQRPISDEDVAELRTRSDVDPSDRLGKVLIEHLTMNEANYWCSCYAMPSNAREYVEHIEKALRAAGISWTYQDAQDVP